MPFFRRLLNFPRTALASLRDKRRATRYPIGPNFPLRAAIHLHGSGNWASFEQNEAGLGRDWLGPLADISSTGVSIRLLPAAVSVKGERTSVRFQLGPQVLEVPCTVSYLYNYRDYSRLGLSLQFPDRATEKAYLQLLESVVMGATMAPWRPLGLRGNPPGLRREQYRSDNGARLYAWRERKSRKLHSFEFYLADHGLRGKAAVPPSAAALEFYTRPRSSASVPKGVGDARYGLSEGEHRELRQLFRLVASNLPTAVPLDLRRFVEGFLK